MTTEPEKKVDYKLTEFADKIWIVDGPDVSFYGFPYPTRMVVVAVHASDGNQRGSWIWSPTPYTPELAQAIQEATGGPVRYIVSPNMIHHIFLKPWQDAFPEAALYAPPGLEGRKVLPEGLTFTATLSDDDVPPFGEEIHQVLFLGGGLEEVVFFHKHSKTAIVCDLIQGFPEDRCRGFKGWLLKMDGLAGPNGSTPREWRFIYWVKGGLPKARTALAKITEEWKPEKLIIAHGDCAQEDAVTVIKTGLSWMGTTTK